MEHLKCNLFCIVKHLSGIAATSLTLILPLDSTRHALCPAPRPARLSCPDCGLQGTQETQWKYLKLAENARSTVPIKSMPFWVGLPLCLSLSRSLCVSLSPSVQTEPSQHFCQPLAIFTPIPLSVCQAFLPLPLAWLLSRSPLLLLRTRPQ